LDPDILESGKISSFPAFLRNVAVSDPVFKNLDFFQVDMAFGSAPVSESADLRFLFDLTMRILHRGVGTLPDIDVERSVAVLYGGDFDLREKPSDSIGCVEWQWNPDAQEAVRTFRDWLDPWEGNSDAVDFDPSHSENERKLFDQLGCELPSKALISPMLL
jgi:hypothetical protein